MRDFSRFDRFLDTLAEDVYPEPPTEPHLSITADMLSRLASDGVVKAGQRASDVECGQGLALQKMAGLGITAVGTPLGPDVEICRATGLDVRAMDQSFLEFADGEFDFLWCRHVLEHSVFPLFTLTEYHRVLKPRGNAYIEVPAPDTACHHQRNRNHYSVLGKSMWASLFQRAGFSLVWEGDIRFTVPAGPDLYWAFLLHKPG
jgi:SAM-dependent methyltransferase